MRLAIVDDDERYAHSVLQTLRAQYPHWDCTSCSSFAEAQVMLRDSDFDVVVCELDMPGGGGNVLLEIIAQNTPGTFRILHSGNTKRGALYKQRSVCHEFISKPCSGQHLIALLREAEEIALLGESEWVQRILLNAKSLPREPKLAMEIDRLLAEDDFHQSKLVEILKIDPIATALLLRAANSALFACAGKIISIEQAIVTLGTRTVRSLVLSAELYTRFSPNSDSQKWLPLMWDHSLEFSNAALQLAAGLRASTKEKEVIFTASILHDIGKLIFLEADEARYIELLQSDSEDELSVLEREHYGVDHAQLGGLLTQRWNLPFELTRAISTHHAAPRPNASLAQQCLSVIEHMLDEPQYDSSCTLRERANAMWQELFGA